MSISLILLMYDVDLDGLKGAFVKTLIAVNEVSSPLQWHHKIEKRFSSSVEKLSSSDTFGNWANTRFTCLADQETEALLAYCSF